jgi:ligand-binding sensor domain-containing protein
VLREGQGGGVGPLIPVAGEIWAATNKGLIRINSASNRVVGLIPGDPCGQTIVESARRFWISRCFAGVMGVNATTHRVDKRISTE